MLPTMSASISEKYFALSRRVTLGPLDRPVKARTSLLLTWQAEREIKPKTESKNKEKRFINISFFSCYAV